MKLGIYCLFDSAVGVYANPMFLQSNGQAIRSLGDEVNRAANDNQLYNHPEDFVLHYMGSFETDTGEFDTNIPVLVIRASDLKK